MRNKSEACLLAAALTVVGRHAQRLSCVGTAMELADRVNAITYCLYPSEVRLVHLT
jgi:hypothetical protein